MAISNFPKNVIEAYPELLETFDSIWAHYQGLQQCRMNEIIPNCKPVTPRVVWSCQIYLQLVIYRTVDMTGSMLKCWEGKEIAPAFVLLCSLVENAAILYVARKDLRKLLQEENFHNIYNYINTLIFSNRIDEKSPYKAKNILTVLGHIDKEIPDFKAGYERLCEYAHPNFMGLAGLYGKMENQYTCTLSTDIGFCKETIGHFFYYLNTILYMIVQGHDEIVGLFDQLKESAIQDMKSRGQNIDPYIE